VVEPTSNLTWVIVMVVLMAMSLPLIIFIMVCKHKMKKEASPLTLVN